MKSNEAVLTVILVAILGIATPVYSEIFNCTLASDNTTMSCNYTTNDSCRTLNTTLINQYFNTTDMVNNLTTQISECRNLTTNLSTRLSVMTDIMNFTSDLVKCQQEYYKCNITMDGCTQIAKNSSDAYMSCVQNATSQIQMLQTQCTNEKSAIKTENDKANQYNYVYLGIAFIAGYFVITQIRKSGTTTKSVDDRTKEDPSERFQV